jgi:tRNA threonylcarbamoyladenosine biosynthesis protein TsaB
MVGNVLVIETSTEAGSVAVARAGLLLAEQSFSSRDPVTGVRTEALAPSVASCLALASIPARELGAVVCGAGPGGFTSLRSAAALAKGLCTALGIPLYAVSSLELLAWSASLPGGTFVVALNAGRNEWFAADVTRVDQMTTLSAPNLVSDDGLRSHAAGMHAQLIGAGLHHDVTPRASAVISRLGEIEARGPVDLDSWEPAYGRLAEAQVKWEATHGRPLVV